MTVSSVPQLDLGRQFSEIGSEIDSAVSEVLASQKYILGPYVEEFEEQFAKYIGVEHAVGMSSGTDALLASLMALNVGPGDEVITTAFSFYSSASCIARLGATPVFVDINPKSLLIDLGKIEKRLLLARRPLFLFISMEMLLICRSCWL